MAYALADDLKGMLGWLRISPGNQAIFQQVSLEEHLDREKARIDAQASVLGYTLPVTPTVPPTAQDLLLELLNLEQPTANLLIAAAGAGPAEMQQYYRGIRLRAAYWWGLYERGFFNDVFDSSLAPLPTTGLVDYSDVSEVVAGLAIGASAIPSQAVIDRIGQRYSIPVYSLLRFRGLRLTGYTTPQAQLVKRAAMDWTVATVVRARGISQTMPALFNSLAYDLDQVAIDSFNRLLRGDYDLVLEA